MTYYTKHLFICVNQRSNGEACCNDAGAENICDYTKKQLKSLGLAGKGGIRINKAGCLGRCDLGPVLVIYPEGIWYRYQTQQDIDEIIHSHLLQGQIVQRLQLQLDDAN